MWTRDGLLLDNTGPLVLTNASTTSYTNVLEVNNRIPGTYTCQIRGADNELLNSKDFIVRGIIIKLYTLISVNLKLSLFLSISFQLFLLLSMLKPLRSVPLPQWRSAGVLHLMDLLKSLPTGSSMATERIN